MPRKSSHKKRRRGVASRPLVWTVVVALLLGTAGLLYVQFPGIGTLLKGQAILQFPGGVYVAAGDVTGDGVPDLITGAGPSGGPHVKVYDGTTHQEVQSFFAFHHTFTGGVRVASADYNRDGKADIIVSAGPGGGPHVKVFSGADPNVVLRSFFAYDPSFTGGVFVAAGDVTGDGVPDIITGADRGGGPHVKVFDGFTNATVRSFMAYDPAFRGGVRVAAADYNRDGKADIITAAGPGGPHVKIFNGATGSLIREWLAYHPAFQGGVFVAAGDVTGDGTPDVITGADAGGGPHVKVFDGVSNAEVRGLFAFHPTFGGGVRVAAADYNRDGQADLIVSAGPGASSHVKVLNGTNPSQELRGFFAYYGIRPTEPSPPPPPPPPPAAQPVCVGEACGPRQPAPPPAPPPANQLTILRGHVDIARSTTIAGWACNPNAPDQPAQIHFYTGAPAGRTGARIIGGVAANLPRPDVASECGGNGNHGFSFAHTGAAFGHAGGHHNVYVHAIDPVSGNNIILGNEGYNVSPIHRNPAERTRTQLVCDAVRQMCDRGEQPLCQAHAAHCTNLPAPPSNEPPVRPVPLPPPVRPNPDTCPIPFHQRDTEYRCMRVGPTSRQACIPHTVCRQEPPAQCHYRRVSSHCVQLRRNMYGCRSDGDFRALGPGC